EHRHSGSPSGSWASPPAMALRHVRGYCCVLRWLVKDGSAMRLEDAHVSSSRFDVVISGDQYRLRRAGSSIVIVVLVAFLLVGAFRLTELTGTESAKVGDTKIGVQYPKTI